MSTDRSVQLGENVGGQAGVADVLAEFLHSGEAVIGDLLLVDNIRTAHSREAFEGQREVLVGLADAVRLTDCSPTVEVTIR